MFINRNIKYILIISDKMNKNINMLSVLLVMNMIQVYKYPALSQFTHKTGMIFISPESCTEPYSVQASGDQNFKFKRWIWQR